MSGARNALMIASNTGQASSPVDGTLDSDSSAEPAGPSSSALGVSAEGLAFETDNDTEAACRFIEWRLRLGETLDEALRQALAALDGFYTLLMATAGQLTLVRDAFACKPAVVAETEAYVAISSEFRSLAHLPGIACARIFEPGPGETHSWRVPIS